MKSIPAIREPAARLELMDQLGVDRTLMFPTLAIHVVVHALNE